MKKLKTMKTIKEANKENTLLNAPSILEHRPNMYLRKMTDYHKKRKKIAEMYLPHVAYSYGFYDGYAYAIERLKKHCK